MKLLSLLFSFPGAKPWAKEFFRECQCHNVRILGYQILSSMSSSAVWCWSWVWQRRGSCSGQPSSAPLASPVWELFWCTAWSSGMEEQWCAPAQQTMQASWELAAAFWSCWCRNVLRTPEGECCLPGVTRLLLLCSIHAGCSWVNHLQVWAFLWYAWPNLMYRLQFEVSRVLKNEMFFES